MRLRGLEEAPIVGDELIEFTLKLQRRRKVNCVERAHLKRFEPSGGPEDPAIDSPQVDRRHDDIDPSRGLIAGVHPSDGSTHLSDAKGRAHGLAVDQVLKQAFGLELGDDELDQRRAVDVPEQV